MNTTTKKRDKKLLINFDAETFAKLQELAEHERTTASALAYWLLYDNIDNLHAQIMARESIKYDFETGLDVITIKGGDN